MMGQSLSGHGNAQDMGPAADAAAGHGGMNSTSADSNTNGISKLKEKEKRIFIDKANEQTQMKTSANANTTDSDPMVPSYFNPDTKELGCKHYSRNCMLKAECCQKWFVCRLCHNDHYQNLPDLSQLSQCHKMDRYATEQIRCMKCGTIQSVSQYCVNPTCKDTRPPKDKPQTEMKETESKEKSVNSANDANNATNEDEHACETDNSNNVIKDCEIKSDDAMADAAQSEAKTTCFGTHFCQTCKFFDNIESYSPTKEIFHCAECQICRLGKRSEFTHCMKCAACIHNSLYSEHTCVERSLHCDCPICLEFLFTSVKPVTFWRHCGHGIHVECLHQWFAKSIQCPLCRQAYYDEREIQEMVAAQAERDAQEQARQEEEGKDAPNEMDDQTDDETDEDEISEDEDEDEEDEDEDEEEVSEDQDEDDEDGDHADHAEDGEGGEDGTDVDIDMDD